MDYYDDKMAEVFSFSSYDSDPDLGLNDPWAGPPLPHQRGGCPPFSLDGHILLNVHPDLDPSPATPAWNAYMPSMENQTEYALMIEVAGLHSHLAVCQLEQEHRTTEIQVQLLCDTFMADDGPPSTPPPSSPSLDDGEGFLPPFPPEAPRRVAAELATVGHMLYTAAIWLQNVNVLSVPPDKQGELVLLMAACFHGGLHLPGAQKVLDGLNVEALHHNHHLCSGGDYLEWEDIDDSPPCPETLPLSAALTQLGLAFGPPTFSSILGLSPWAWAPGVPLTYYPVLRRGMF